MPWRSAAARLRLCFGDFVGARRSARHSSTLENHANRASAGLHSIARDESQRTPMFSAHECFVYPENVVHATPCFALACRSVTQACGATISRSHVG
jgi:hypothetical protein